MQSTVKKANISHQNVFLSTVFEECLKCYSDVCFQAFNMFWNIEWENLDIHWKEQNRNTHLKKKIEQRISIPCTTNSQLYSELFNIGWFVHPMNIFE